MSGWTGTICNIGMIKFRNNLYVDINILCDVSESEYRINSLSSKSNFFMCKYSVKTKFYRFYDHFADLVEYNEGYTVNKYLFALGFIFAPIISRRFLNLEN